MSTPRSAPVHLLAVLALLLTLLPASAALAAPAAQGTITPRPASAASKPDPTDQSVSRYIVQLRGAPVALHLAQQTGAPAAKLDLAAPAAVSQQRALRAERAAALQAIDAALGDTATPVASYEVVFNGVALELTGAQAARVAGLPQVAAVTKEELHTLTSDVGPQWIGAAGIWDGSATGVFAATLLGANQVPPVSSPASGRGIFSFDAAASSLTYRVQVSGFTEPVTAAHIHRATDDTVVAPLVGGNGSYSGVITLAAADAGLLRDGDLYVNLHTATNPGGEIRGDLDGYQGEGVVVGIIDSGINTTHPSFAAVAGDGYRHLNPLGAGKYRGACDPTNLPSRGDGNPSGYNPAISCNDKLIGAWTFADTAPVGSPAGEPSPNDSDGHGTHTASTAAGNLVLDSNVSGTPYGRIAGVAPRANIIAYDVCGFLLNGAYDARCPTVTSVAAIEQAVRDQVDVINYSIGGGTRPWVGPVEQAFLAARAAGVVVSASAGNDGPGASTLSHVGPWLLTVAASTHNRKLLNEVTDLAATAGPAAPANIVGAGFSGALTTSTPIVYAGSPTINNALCGQFSAAQAAAVAGKVVICDRGTFGRVEKAQNVLTAGGAGYVLANNAASGNSLSGDVFPLPGVHITYDDGVALKAWVAAATGPTARISGTSRNLAASNGDVMGAFSSRGPALGFGMFTLKPDLAAPGVDVFAAHANNGIGAPDYQFLSGTSMAAPHVAGAAALVAGLNPAWTPGQIQSALTTTALDGLRKEDALTPTTPYDSGAGRVRVDEAALAGLVLDETQANFLAANPGTGGDPRTLNTPSMTDPGCIASCSWTRTVRSTLDVPATWTATTSEAGLTVSPASFTIAPGATQTLTISLSVNGKATGSTIFGRVTLSAANGVAPDAAFPVAATVQDSDLPTGLLATGGSGTMGLTLPVRTRAYSGLSVQHNGMTKGTSATVSIKENEPAVTEVLVPADTSRLVAEVLGSTAPDADLYIFRDDGDGVPSNGDTQVCSSLSFVSLEYCNLTKPVAGRYFVEVHTFTPSAPGATDTANLVTAVVPQASADNFTVSGPASNPGGDIDLSFALNLAGSQPGDHWYGRFSMTDTGTSQEFAATNIDFIHSEVAAMNMASGDAQSAKAGAAFGSPLEVIVTDSSGTRLVGVPVTFAAPATGASATLSAATVTTDLFGVARVTATANGTLGTYEVTASVAGGSGVLEAKFALTNTVGDPARVNLSGGNRQSAQVGTAFGARLAVTVTDGFGNPVKDVTVTFAAPTSGASATLSGTTATTGADGTASVAATANGVTGVYVVTATIGSGDGKTVSFGLINSPGAAARVSVDGGNRQSARVGTAFGAPLVVTVTDSFGNLVPGAAVTFAAPTSGASATLSAPSITTGADGKASVTATANGVAGAYTVTASIGSGDGKAVSFSLTNTAAPQTRFFVHLPLVRR